MSYPVKPLSAQEFFQTLQMLTHLGENGQERIILEQTADGYRPTLAAQVNWFEWIITWIVELFLGPQHLRIHEIGAFVLQFLNTHHEFLVVNRDSLISLRGRISKKANIDHELSQLIHETAAPYIAHVRELENRSLAVAEEQQTSIFEIKENCERSWSLILEERDARIKNVLSSIKEEQRALNDSKTSHIKNALNNEFHSYIPSPFNKKGLFRSPPLLGLQTMTLKCIDGNVEVDAHLMRRFIPFFRPTGYRGRPERGHSEIDLRGMQVTLGDITLLHRYYLGDVKFGNSLKEKTVDQLLRHLIFTTSIVEEAISKLIVEELILRIDSDNIVDFLLLLSFREDLLTYKDLLDSVLSFAFAKILTLLDT